MEVAAGTGYWSQFIAPQAAQLTAIDATPEALTQIRARPGCADVTTHTMDAYQLDTLTETYNAAFAGLWLSHVPKQKLALFLDGLHRVLQPGATILLIDNSQAQCQRLPLSHWDEQGNSYQQRQLADGSSHQVLKNFPSHKELLELTADRGINHYYKALEHFWLFQYNAV